MGYEDDKHPRDEHGRFTSGGLSSWANAKTGTKTARDRFAELPKIDLKPSVTVLSDADARERTKDVTPAQARALGVFTNSSGDYEAIRAAEKDEQPRDADGKVTWGKMLGLSKDNAQKYAQDIHEFFKTAKPSPGVAYRGMAADDEKLGALLDKDTITMAASSSTSRMSSEAQEFADRHVRNDTRTKSVWAGGDKEARAPLTPVLLRLKQKSGVAIHHLSANPQEKEVLLPKGASFHITKRAQSGGYLVVDAEER